MPRDDKPYSLGGEYSTSRPLSDEWLDPGFYKIRLRAAGPWVPIEVTMQDGERDPETWELLSDQRLSAEWYPQTNSARPYNIDPRRLFGRAFPIDRSEFEWLITLRQIRR